MTTQAPTQEMTESFIERLREAVQSRDVAMITEKIKRELEEFIPAEGLVLPDRFRRPRADSYARRLLHRDPDLDFTAVVMTWGPSQRTPLHDHSGIWCVEERWCRFFASSLNSCRATASRRRSSSTRSSVQCPSDGPFTSHQVRHVHMGV